MRLSRLPILKRLIPSLRRRVRLVVWPKGWRIVRVDGVSLLINYHSFTDRLIAAGAWERAQLEYFLGGIARRGCEVFLDIGAYIGLYAVLVAAKTECREIIAFEPDPLCHERLRANLLLNNLIGRIETRPVALSDRAGRIPFFRETVFGASKSRVVPNGSFSVACARLDDSIALAGRRIALKIDIEDHEREALDGMKALLKNNRCFIQVECSDGHLAEVRRALADLGYRPVHEIGVDRYFTNEAG